MQILTQEELRLLTKEELETCRNQCVRNMQLLAEEDMYRREEERKFLESAISYKDVIEGSIKNQDNPEVKAILDALQAKLTEVNQPAP